MWKLGKKIGKTHVQQIVLIIVWNGEVNWPNLDRDGGVVHFLNKSGSCLVAKLVEWVIINRLAEYVSKFVVSDHVSIHWSLLCFMTKLKEHTREIR